MRLSILKLVALVFGAVASLGTVAYAEDAGAAPETFEFQARAGVPWIRRSPTGAPPPRRRAGAREASPGAPRGQSAARTRARAASALRKSPRTDARPPP